jgi:hypothetical protein
VSVLVQRSGQGWREWEAFHVKALQKIVKNGNSMQVTIPRAILFEQNLRPGDFVVIESVAGQGFTVTPFVNPDNVSFRSPGLIPSTPGTSTR